MKKTLLIAILMLLAVGVRAQDDFTSSRLETIANRLKRDTVDLSERSSEDLRNASTVTRSLIEEAFLAAQLDASVGIFQDMVRDRRRASELREAAALLSDLGRRAPTVSNNGAMWRTALNSIADLNRELGTGGGTGGGVDNRPIIGRVFWRGMVDDRIQLVISGNQIETRTISGRSYPDGTYSFTSALPAREVSVAATRTRGRGSVRILQQPSKANGFKAIVEIYDDGGGARDYQLDIFWK